MPKRPSGGSANSKGSTKKARVPKPEKDRHAEEKSVAAVYSRAAPGDGTLPLRLLNNFFLYIRDPDSGTERAVGLEDLHNGKAGGLPLRARGTLLEHRAAGGAECGWGGGGSGGGGGGAAADRGRIVLHHVRDWVVDHTQPAPAIWLVTGTAWYRLISPAFDYISTFQTALLRLRLAVTGANLVTQDARASFQAVAPSLLAQANAVGAPQPQQLYGTAAGGFGNPQFGDAGPALGFGAAGNAPLGFAAHGFGGSGAGVDHQMADAGDEALDQVDTYAAAGAYVAAGPADLQQQASFLLPQLAPFAGRHIITGDFMQQLGALANIPAASAMSSVRKLRNVATGVPAADPRGRPQPRTDFEAPPHLLPGVLMVWDFCHRYRQLLRLPPFPLPRLEAAFMPPERGGCSAPPAFERGPSGQALLLRDIHVALLRVLESADDNEPLPPPAAACAVAPQDLGPHDAFRPLLGVTWPEMVRTVLAGHPLTQDAATSAAFKALKGQSYETLEAEPRFLILDALLHIAADSEALRSHIQRTTPTEGCMAEPGLLGEDGGGMRYLQLGGREHGGLLLVETPQGGHWGRYSAQHLPQLIGWLENGSDAEQGIADAVFEAYQALLPPGLTGRPGQRQPPAPPQADGYAGLPPLRPGRDQLAEVMGGLVRAAPFWERGEDWLACRAGVLASLHAAASGSAFARLLWLVEELTYEEALRGTGWGRRRGWFRDALDKCTTVSQTAMVTAALASHCRRAPDMGLLDQAAFLGIVHQQGNRPPPMPRPKEEVVLVGGAYADARRALQPGAAPLEWPAGWRALETCTVLEVAYTRGQAPVTRAAAEDVSKAATWALLEPVSQPQQLQEAEEADQTPLPAACDGEIDWTLFSFSHGFRHPRAGSNHPALGPRLVAASLAIAPDRETIVLSLKALPTPQRSPTAAAMSPAAAATEAGASAMDATPVAGGSPTSTTTTAHLGLDGGGGSVHGGQLAAAAGLQYTGLPEPTMRARRPAGDGTGGGFQEAAAPTAAAGLAAAQPHQGGWHAGPPALQGGLFDVDGLALQGGRGMRRIESTESALAGASGGRRGFKRDSAETAEHDEGLGGGAKRSTRTTRRGGPAEFYELDRDNLARIKAEPAPPKPVLGGLKRTASGNLVPVADDAPIQFWVKRRRLVAVELRPVPPAARLPQFLLPPATVAQAAAKEWPPGTGVKMPMAGTLADALAPENAATTRWHTGILPHGFSPSAAGAATQHERLTGALGVVWDEATTPPLPARLSPWEVVEDAARKSRQVERSRAGALAAARKVADVQTRQEAATAGASGHGRVRGAPAGNSLQAPQPGQGDSAARQQAQRQQQQQSPGEPMHPMQQQLQDANRQALARQQQFQPQPQPQPQRRQAVSMPASALAALPPRQQQLLHASRAAAAAGQQLAPALQAELVALYRQLQAAHQQTVQQEAHGSGLPGSNMYSHTPPLTASLPQDAAQVHGYPAAHQWQPQQPQQQAWQPGLYAGPHKGLNDNAHIAPGQPQASSPPPQQMGQQHQLGLPHSPGGRAYQNGWQQSAPRSTPRQTAAS